MSSVPIRSKEWRQHQKKMMMRSARLILDKIAHDDIVGSTKAFSDAVCQLSPDSALDLSRIIASKVRAGSEIADYLSHKHNSPLIHVDEKILPPGKCAFFVACHHLAPPNAMDDSNKLTIFEKCQYDSIAGPLSRIILKKTYSKSIPDYFGRLEMRNKIFCEFFEFVPGRKIRISEYTLDHLRSILSIISDIVVNTAHIERSAKKRGLVEKLIQNRRNLKRVKKTLGNIQEVFGQSYPDETNWFKNYVKYEDNIIKRYYRIPSSITHNDLHSHNIIFHKDGNPFVIDWDSVSLSPVGTDLRIICSFSETVQAEAIKYFMERLNVSGNQRLLSRFKMDDIILASTVSQFYVYLSSAQRSRSIHQLRAAIRIGYKLLEPYTQQKG